MILESLGPVPQCRDSHGFDLQRRPGNTGDTMNDYLLLMHNDAPDGIRDRGREAWGTYITKLEDAGCFEGGSSIGDGLCASKSGSAPGITRHVSGYIRIHAKTLEHARELLAGNPVFEAGGTVEIRELPRT